MFLLGRFQRKNRQTSKEENNDPSERAVEHGAAAHHEKDDDDDDDDISPEGSYSNNNYNNYNDNDGIRVDGDDGNGDNYNYYYDNDDDDGIRVGAGDDPYQEELSLDQNEIFRDEEHDEAPVGDYEPHDSYYDQEGDYRQEGDYEQEGDYIGEERDLQDERKLVHYTTFFFFVLGCTIGFFLFFGVGMRMRRNQKGPYEDSDSSVVTPPAPTAAPSPANSTSNTAEPTTPFVVIGDDEITTEAPTAIATMEPTPEVPTIIITGAPTSSTNVPTSSTTAPTSTTTEPTLAPLTTAPTSGTTVEPTSSTKQPTAAPSGAPSVGSKKCFANKEELRTALQIVDVDTTGIPSFILDVYGPVSDWCVKNINDFEGLFAFMTNFNEDVSGWDVSQGKSMGRVCHAWRPLDHFSLFLCCCIAVTTMRDAFKGASSFNQDLTSWVMSSVTDITGMFEDAVSFSKYRCKALAATILGSLSTNSFVSIRPIDGAVDTWMFSPSLTRMDRLFAGSAFNSHIEGWDVSRVVSMEAMFWRCTSFNQ